MKFLFSDFFIWGFFLIVPLIFYFLRKPDVKKYYIPTFKFIKIASKKKKKVFNLKEFLMMILRTLIILLIILAVAKPVLDNVLIAGEKDFVLIIDDSFSLNLFFKNENEYKDYIKNNIKNIIPAEINPEISFIYRNSDNFQYEIFSNLDDLKFQNKNFSINQAMEYTYSRFADEVNILLISDMLESNFANITEDMNEKINFFQIDKTPVSNIWVSDIEFSETAFKNKEEPVYLTISNSHHSTISGRASIEKNNTVINSKLFNVESNSKTEILFNIDLKNSGIQKYKVVLEGDDFKRDNKYYFSFNVRDKINILHTGKKLNTFLRRALTSNSLISPFRVSSLDNANIEYADFVIADDLSSIEQEKDILKQLIKKSIDIILFPSNISSFNNYLYKHGLSPVKLYDYTGGIRKARGEEILSMFNFSGNYLLDDFASADEIIFFDDRIPAYAKSSIENSNLHFFNFVLGPETTDFIFSPYFVYYWYEFFKGNLEAQDDIFYTDTPFIPQEIAPSERRTDKVLKEPGFYTVEDKLIVFNLPSTGSDISRIEKNEEIINISQQRKIKGEFNLRSFFGFLLIFLLILEFFLSDRWL
ncbi:MAG: BatA domain-containing protein [Candidatus Muiribacteriota bacterium]